MRQHLFLLAASGGGASARWLRWSGSEVSHGRIPIETGTSSQDEVADGWTPRPTPAPAYGELRRNDKRQTTTNTWLNDKTCGWLSGVSSSAMTCAQNQKCATNTDNVVGCLSGAVQPFFTVCFDLAASKEGRCEFIGPQTGCCNKPEASACATYIWSGSPARSMYTCGPSATIVALNDQPQFVIDASKSTSTSTTSTPTPGSNTTVTSSTSQTGTTTTASPPPETTGGSNTNLGVIIGSVVGGLFGLILLLLLLCCLCRRRNQTTNKNSNSKAYNITHTVPLGRVKRAKDLPGSSSSNIPGLYGPYVANAAREDRGRESHDSRDAGSGRGATFGALLGIGANRSRLRGVSPVPATGPPPRPERPDHPNPTAPAYRPADIRHERNMSGSTVREATQPPPPQPPQLHRHAPLRTPSPPSPPRFGNPVPERTPGPPSPPSSTVYPATTRLGQSAGSSSASARLAGDEVRLGPVRKKQGTNEMTVYF